MQQRTISAFLGEVERQLRRHPHGAVAVLAASQPNSLAAHIGRTYPAARVVEVDTQQPASALHAFLAAHGPFDVIAADTRRARDRVGLFRDTFFHLGAGGAFIMRVPRPGTAGLEPVRRFVRRILQEQAMHRENIPETRLDETWLDETRLDEARLAESIGDVILKRSHLVVTSKVRALAKLREDEVNTVLEQRAWASGRILANRPGVTWVSRSEVRTSGSIGELLMPKSYQAPDIFLREYYDVVCLPGQVAVQANLILPDTYRHNQQKRLRHSLTYDFSARFATPTSDMGQARPLTGAYFYLDSESPGHFGHAMTEQVSRLWAWQQAKRAEPSLKVLRSLRRSKTRIRAHELHIFRAAGIDIADLVLFDSAVMVERLVAATPMFSMPEYVHPDIREVWHSIGRRLATSAPSRDYARRIFCARKTTKRRCRNTRDVEAVFASRGFQVIYPEDFPLPEQAAMFRHAEVVAGYAGSALFTLAFCETPKRVIMISSEAYRARNEYMIASVLGHELNILWCRPDAPQAANEPKIPGQFIAFTFDFAREGRYLEELLASL
jgi:capsular polysaccharide biosynthesis protein